MKYNEKIKVKVWTFYQEAANCIMEEIQDYMVNISKPNTNYTVVKKMSNSGIIDYITLTAQADNFTDYIPLAEPEAKKPSGFDIHLDIGDYLVPEGIIVDIPDLPSLLLKVDITTSNIQYMEEIHDNLLDSLEWGKSFLGDSIFLSTTPDKNHVELAITSDADIDKLGPIRLAVGHGK